MSYKIIRLDKEPVEITDKCISSYDEAYDLLEKYMRIFVL